MSDKYESVFDSEAIGEFYKLVLREILPNARHKSLGYFGPPTKKAGAISLDLADVNSIHKGSEYYYRNTYKFIHYTSVQNAVNIIRDKSIRLYNLQGMDDIEEFNVSLKFLNKKLGEYEVQEIKKNIFCLSMCEATVENEEKSLSMWRQYAQDGNGIGLIFKFSKYSSTQWVYYMLSKVYYDEKQLLKFKKAEQAYLEFRDKYKISITTFDEMFYRYYAFHKNKIYSAEKEVRLLYTSGFSTYDKPKTYIDINRKGEKTSFIKLDFEWQWDSKTKKFLQGQGIKPTNVLPKFFLDTIVFGYRLSNATKNNVASVIHKLSSELQCKPKLMDSSLTKYFSGEKV